MTEHVKVQIDAGVMTITLARPEKKNALSNAMYGVLADSLEAAEQDPAIRVVVFQGDGDSFTAGNDLQDFTAQATGAFSGERHVTRFLKALANATRPLVAAVQGQAVGVGTTMLLHCDLVFDSPDARLTTPFVNLALVPALKHLVRSTDSIGSSISKPDVTEHSYPRTPLKAVHAMMMLWADVRARLDLVYCPILLMRSDADDVVPALSRDIVLRQVSSEEIVEIALPNSRHVALIEDAFKVLIENPMSLLV